MVLRSCERPSDTLRATSSALPRWKKTLPTIRMACVTRKTRKMGIRMRIDSRMPLRFNTVRAAMATSSTGSFQTCHCGGKLLKMGSPPPAHHARARTDQARGDDVPPASEGKMLDDLGVGRRDDQDGQAGREGEEDGQVLVIAEVLERLLGAVGAGRQPVRAQSHPGEEGRQRERVEEVRVLEVLGPTQQDPLEPLPPADGPRDRRFGWWGRNGARRRGGRGLLHGRPLP